MSKKFINERFSENDFLELIKFNNYKKDFLIDIQKSNDVNIEKILKKIGGKSGKSMSGIAKPEFLFRKTNHKDKIIIVEIKSETKFHKSKEGEYKPIDFAVDGLYHYCKGFKKTHDVLGIAFSGTKEKYLIDAFIWKNDSQNWEKIEQNNEVLSLKQYWNQFLEKKKNVEEVNFSNFTAKLHNDLRSLSYSVKSKPLFVSMVIFSLLNNEFKNSYKNVRAYNPLKVLLLDSVKNVLKNAELKSNKIDHMMMQFKSLLDQNDLKKNGETGKPTLYELIYDIDTNVMHFFEKDSNKAFDVMGEFYKEFISYVGADGKELGIVLTPKYITELFSKLGYINEDSVLIDTCAGTGGFLVSGMKQMVSIAKEKNLGKEKIKHIKRNQLFAIEDDPDNFALLISNMVANGDGKSQVWSGNCFYDEVWEEISKINDPNLCFINPPYNKKDEPELRFIFEALEKLNKNSDSFLISITPLNTATNNKNKDWRERLLLKHTLVATMTMDSKIFEPYASVGTIIMVWKANRPHQTNDKVWMSDWSKHNLFWHKYRGWIDKNNLWNETLNKWINDFKTLNNQNGLLISSIDSKSDWFFHSYKSNEFEEVNNIEFDINIRKYFFTKLNKEELKNG